MAGLGMSAHARDTQVLMSLRTEAAQPGAQKLLKGSDFMLRVGGSIEASIPQDRLVVASGYARPQFRYPGYNQPTIRSDETTCREAFQNTLAELIAAARKKGAAGVTQVVSYYNNMLMANSDMVECHAGYGSAEVQLRGVLMSPGQGGGSDPARHSRAMPPASGFATIENVDAVPVREGGQARYRYYLSLPSPKAFAVYETGGWRFEAGEPDAMVRLLNACTREGKTCWLYAVDDRVVWQPRLEQRVSRPDQLMP